MNRGTSRRRGIALDDWIKLMAVLSVVLSIVGMFVQAGVAQQLGIELSGGARAGGGACGFLFLMIFAWLGVKAVESGWRIIAWIIASLFTLNVLGGVFVVIAMLVVGNSQVVKDGVDAAKQAELERGAAVTPTPSPSGVQSSATSRPTPSMAPPSPGIAANRPAPSPEPIRDASPDPSPAITQLRQALDTAATSLTADMRAFARLAAQPPAADKKSIDDRKAAALALQAKVQAKRDELSNVPTQLQSALAAGGSTAIDPATKARALVSLSMQRRTLAADELHEMTALAIRECDTLSAALGSWRLEGGKIVGKDPEQTTQLNDARFFLRAKLNQLETRITQLRGG
jgi:hypothetical protein